MIREGPLQAVLAKQTMLTRMSLFNCNYCTERFPAFHPAYTPDPSLQMELLKHGADGVAPCNIEVAMWDTLPPLEAPEEDLLLAEEHRGVCLRCHVDVQGQRRL